MKRAEGEASLEPRRGDGLITSLPFTASRTRHVVCDTFPDASRSERTPPSSTPPPHLEAFFAPCLCPAFSLVVSQLTPTPDCALRGDKEGAPCVGIPPTGWARGRRSGNGCGATSEETLERKGTRLEAARGPRSGSGFQPHTPNRRRGPAGSPGGLGLPRPRRPHLPGGPRVDTGTRVCCSAVLPR